MESVVLVIHLILALAIIGLVLLQRSEGGGLGIGGGGGGLGGFASAKGTANALTKMTAICAAGFFITSLTLGVLASKNSKQNIGLLEDISSAQIEVLSSADDKDGTPTGISYTPPSEVDIPHANSTEQDVPANDVNGEKSQDHEAETKIDDAQSAVNNSDNKLQSIKNEPSAPVE